MNTYLMKAYLPKNKHLYKIGKSTNVKRRLRTMRENTFGFDVDLIYYIKGDYELETHHKFDHCRIHPRREWFDFNLLDLYHLYEFFSSKSTLHYLDEVLVKTDEESLYDFFMRGITTYPPTATEFPNMPVEILLAALEL